MQAMTMLTPNRVGRHNPRFCRATVVICPPFPGPSPKSIVKVRMPAELGQRVNQELEAKESGTPEPPGWEAHRRRAERGCRDAGPDHQEGPANEPNEQASGDLRQSR